MAVKIKVEINSDVAGNLRRHLEKYHRYEYVGKDSQLMEDLVSSIETLSGHELAKILLGCCAPEELLGKGK